MPIPARHFRPASANAPASAPASAPAHARGTAPADAPSHWEVTGMMDQHAYLRIAPGDDVRVGDMIAFDISHPCLTFDKWRHIPVLDDELRVVDIVQTFF